MSETTLLQSSKAKKGHRFHYELIAVFPSPVSCWKGFRCLVHSMVDSYIWQSESYNALQTRYSSGNL